MKAHCQGSSGRQAAAAVWGEVGWNLELDALVAHHVFEVVLVDTLRQAALPLLLSQREAVAASGLDAGRNQAQRNVLRQVAHEERHLLQERCPEQVTLSMGAQMNDWKVPCKDGSLLSQGMRR